MGELPWDARASNRDWLFELGYGPCDERELFYGERGVDMAGSGMCSLWWALEWMSRSSVVEVVSWQIVEVLMRVEGQVAWGPPGCGMITINLERPAVVWWRGVLRPAVVQRVLSLMGYIHHSRVEEWRRRRGADPRTTEG